MKKVKKSLQNLQKASIDFDQLSQIKGGSITTPHDLFSARSAPYDNDEPDEELL